MPHDQIEKFVSAIKPSDRYNEWMICVDPNGILQEQYKRRYTEYSEEQKLFKNIEIERDKLVQEQEDLKWVEAVSQELRENIKCYNEIVPDVLKLEVYEGKVEIDEFLKIMTRAKNCNAILRDELKKAKKNQEILDFYLDRDGEYYAQLLKELHQRSDEYHQCEKNLKNHRLYEKLRIELETAYKVQENLQRECEILRYIQKQGRDQMEQKIQQFFAVSEQLPEWEQILKSLIKKLTKIDLSLKDLYKKIEQVQLEKSLWDTNEKKLLEIAGKAEELKKQKTAELLALEQKKEVVEETLRRKKAQQKQRKELSAYILPAQFGDYIAHPIPQDHPLFTYTTEIDELMRRYHTNQTRQTSYDKQVQKAKEAEQDLLYIADQGRSFLEQHPEQCECPLCHTRFESWNLLYGATLKLESSQKKQLKEEARQIQQETASINNDEKNEPELYIKTLADKREPYHPELFFSTAQLNTVALSSFLSRALSLTEIPIGTIVIDDPVGHFDDMNILGFADLMRSIIEKSQKQIVITTHDETVYQIFRRKLPPEIYSSRFIDMTAE